MTIEELRDDHRPPTLGRRSSGRAVSLHSSSPRTTVAYFKALGYHQSIETNGTRRPPAGLDYITCSPKKEAMQLLHRNFPDGVGEFRFPVGSPADLPPAVSELPPRWRLPPKPDLRWRDAE